MLLIQRAKQFLTVDLWRLKVDEMPARRAMLVRALRVLAVAVRDFETDRISLRASALTFYTLMSVVPILALSFGVAKGFGFEQRLEAELRSALPNQTEVIERFILFAQQLLEQTRGGLIAGIGLIVLFWTVIKVLGHIEHSFNDIWELKQGRPFLRKFSDYMAFAFVAPILFLISSSMTVFVTSQLETIITRLEFLGPVATLLISAVRLLSLAILWVLLAFTYLFMPNTKVQVKSALVAGILAGTMFFLLQVAYVRLQIGAGKANAIYGSFAALPLFLTWLQLSWIIVLFGAEVAWAHQNLERFEWGQESRRATRHLRHKVQVAIMRVCVHRFCTGAEPPTFRQLQQEVDAPRVLMQSCLEELRDARLLSRTLLDDGESVGYQPACDVSELTVADVLARLDSVGEGDVPIGGNETAAQAYAKVDELICELRSIQANRLIKDL